MSKDARFKRVDLSTALEEHERQLKNSGNAWRQRDFDTHKVDSTGGLLFTVGNAIKSPMQKSSFASYLAYHGHPIRNMGVIYATQNLFDDADELVECLKLIIREDLSCNALERAAKAITHYESKYPKG